MRRRSASIAAASLAAGLWLAPRPALAEDAPPAWPVRANLSMPFGSTLGREKLHGFTWGFRGALLAYPTSNGRGVGFGGHADALIDAQTHSMWSLGAVSTVPVARFELVDFRLGGLVAMRQSGEGNDDARRLAVGVFSELDLPAYLYDFRVGIRVDGTFDDRGMSATSLLLEVDLIALFGLFAYAGAH